MSVNSIPSQIQNDVVIVGAGPAGLATAAILKTINNDLNVCVLDIREGTRRHYGLSLAKDSIEAVNAVLKKHLGSTDSSKNQLISLLNSWKGTVQPVKIIEESLTARATELGVRVIRKKNYKEIITKADIDKLLVKAEPLELSEIQKELRQHFQHAKVVIDASGAHSPIRQRYMVGGDEEQRVDVKNFQYFIELKYETLHTTEERTFMSISKEAKCTSIAFETMSNKKNGPHPTKPATMHFFVGQRTYDAFQEATDAMPWDLETLQEKATTDPIVANQTLKIAHYLYGLSYRGGSCLNPKIKRLPITMYRSAEITKLYEGKVIVEVGDAASGAILARGVNKAFKEAAQLAENTNEFFRSGKEIQNDVPDEFRKYEKAVSAIYEEEKKSAEFKTFWISLGRVSLRYALKPLKFIFTPITALYLYIKSLWFPEPKLGELIEKLSRKPMNNSTSD